MVDYQSCVHLLPDTILKAIRKVKDVCASCRFNDTCLYHCLDCDYHGKLNDKAFRIHALNSGHTVGVRIRDPAELYCFACKDFQFSSQFDKFTKRKRSRTGIYYSRFGSKISKTVAAGGVCGQVKGLCNMGATCFMSAVLQILMKNSVLMNCDQMHTNIDRCKTVIERSISIDNTSRHSGDTAPSQVAPSNPTCIFCEFKKICIETTREDSVETIVPANLLHAVWNELDYLAGYQQQDAHEFLIAFLDGLDQHLKLNHASATSKPLGLSVNIPPSPVMSGVEISPSASVRKSPRSDGKQRCLGHGGQTPTPLRRSFSENDPSSVGSVLIIPRIAEVLQVFRGTLQSHLTCKSCGHESIKNESFLDLSLSLNRCAVPPTSSTQSSVCSDRIARDNRINSTGVDEYGQEVDTAQIQEMGMEIVDQHCEAQPALSLTDCMRSFTTLETLGEKIFCTECSKNQDSQKQLFLSTPPNVLILHLKRFDVLHDTKITTKVNIQLTDFDVSEFIGSNGNSAVQRGGEGGNQEGANGTSNNTHTSPGVCGNSGGNGASSASTTAVPPSRADSVYDLQGVVSHSGTLHAGHYIAYTLDMTFSASGTRDKKQWIRCDDEVVTVVSEEDVLEAEAYVLFYVKKKFM